jgi:arylsulfatase A-like enzyme
MRVALRLAVIALVAIAFSCGTESGPLNVIIIAVDTLRPDHLGCYGYARNTSRNIDRLAARGALFQNAISQAPWTLPSFATVFTSLYPTQHGATTVETRMRSTIPTLATTLGDRGYLTYAIINAPVLRPEFGLDKGFEYYNVMPSGVERSADVVTEEALKWIEGHRDRPLFMFVHYFDPHLSYSPPRPYDTLFDPGYTGPIGNSFNLDYFSSMSIPTMREEITSLSDEDRNHIVSLYDGEIAFTDSAVGVLLDGLAERGLDDNTLIILLSDHGEEFFDHGGLDHGHSLYNELIHVPLLFSLPGRVKAGNRTPTHVRLIDVAPTILDILGCDSPEHFEGTSLLPLISPAGDSKLERRGLLPPGNCYSEALRHSMTIKSVIAYPWKVIYDISADQEIVFNLEDDPGETLDLVDGKPAGFTGAEQALFQAIGGLSNAWYIRMAGGEDPHIFDLEILARQREKEGVIRLLTATDVEGSAVDIYEIADVETRPSRRSVLKIRDLNLDKELTLALQVEPKGIPVEFDLKIDARRVPKRTYLGVSLANPNEMPFSRKGGRKVLASDGPPARRPDAPYFLIWQTQQQYEGDTAVELDDATKRELRALGYIQ